MKALHTRLSLAFLIFCLRVASGQGFLNMDFESATVPATPTGQWGGFVNPALAFPGWTVGGSGTVVFYNNLSIGAPAVGLMGPDFPNGPGLTPLQGSYSVLLTYFNTAGPPPTLSQTGVIPVDATSISFLVGANWANAAISIDGISLPLVSISGGRLAADVSAYAGSAALLTFSTKTGNHNDPDLLYFDDVQFSPSQVPEPSIMSLVCFGVLLLICPKTRPN